MHLVHHNFKAACLLSFYLSLCRMATCKFVLFRSCGVFAHDVSILYPLQFNWFSVFHACRFYNSAKPFLFRSQFLVSSSPEPADPDESLSVCSPKDHVFFFTDHCFRESVVRQWSFDPFVVIFLPQVALFLVIFSHLPAEIPGIFLDSLSSRLSIKAMAFGSSLAPRGPKSLTNLPRDRLIFHFIFSLHSAILRLEYKSTVSVTLTTGGDVGLRPDAGPDLTEAVESA